MTLTHPLTVVDQGMRSYTLALRHFVYLNISRLITDADNDNNDSKIWTRYTGARSPAMIRPHPRSWTSARIPCFWKNRTKMPRPDQQQQQPTQFHPGQLTVNNDHPADIERPAHSERPVHPFQLFPFMPSNSSVKINGSHGSELMVTDDVTTSLLRDPSQGDHLTFQRRFQGYAEH